MTNPVDTVALRDIGATLTNDGHAFGPRITAAADEVDRLRAERDDWVRMFCDADQGRRRNWLALDVLRAELVGFDSDTPAWKRVAYQRRALRNLEADRDRLQAQRIRAIEQFNEVCERSDAKTVEINRLRSDNERIEGEHASVKAQRDHIIGQYQALRAAVENAPHEELCPSQRHAYPKPCTCWKADAL